MAGVELGVPVEDPVPVGEEEVLLATVPELDFVLDTLVVVDPLPVTVVVVDTAAAEPEEVAEFPIVDPCSIVSSLLLVLLACSVLLELESSLPPPPDPDFGFRTPPWTFPTEELDEVPAAADLYAARVLPDDGGLITPAMPAWQCDGVPQKNQIGSVLVTLTWKMSDYKGTYVSSH